MNRTEIEAKWNTLTPRERDAWVEEVIFGRTSHKQTHGVDYVVEITQSDGTRSYPMLPKYTKDNSAVWAVVGKIANIDVGKRRNSYYQVAVGNSSGYVFVNRTSATEAICLAAIIARLTEVSV